MFAKSYPHEKEALGVRKYATPKTATVLLKIGDNVITVFYDGKCRLCSKEISHYRKIAPDGIFDWQDINESDDDLRKENISLLEGLKLLHAKDEEGLVHVGVDAFILIWKQLKWWRTLAVFVEFPITRQVTSVLYRYFASWRFKRLEHCQLAVRRERDR